MKALKIFIGMSRILNKINRVTGKVHQQYGLTTPQFAVLEALYHKGDLSIGDVQEKVLSTGGTMPVIVKNLLREGLITKTQDAKDKRKFILSITNKGQALMDQVYPENEALIISELSTWSEEEQNTMIQLISKARRNTHETTNNRKNNRV